MVNGVIRSCSKSLFTYVAHGIIVNLHRIVRTVNQSK